MGQKRGIKPALGAFKEYHWEKVQGQSQVLG